MKNNKHLLKYVYILLISIALCVFSSCSKNSSVNIVYYYLVGKVWQETGKQDINGNTYVPSFTRYFFYPDFRLMKQCYIDPFCVNDNNGNWSLTPNNQYLTILTNSGFVTAEIILIQENILIIKPINSIFTLTFTTNF